MKIKKGDRFLCIKDVVMENGRIDYIKGKEYLSEISGFITDEEGYVYHSWDDVKYLKKYFKKITSSAKDAEEYRTHINKGGKYVIISDDAKFQVGDLWIRAVVYECLDNSVIYVREYENFCKRFCPLN